MGDLTVISNISENDIVRQLGSWQLEVESGRNDGWTRAHYLQKIIKVKEYVDKHLASYSHKVKQQDG